MISPTQGFSLNGVHCSELGLTYAPDSKDQEYRIQDFKNDDLTTPKKIGSYFMGATIQPKVFKLRCFFQHVTQRQLTKIVEWVQPNIEYGLILDKRDWCQYQVWSNKTPDIQIWESNRGTSGLIEYELIAMMSYAKMSQSYAKTEDHARLQDYLDILDEATSNSLPIDKLFCCSKINTPLSIQLKIEGVDEIVITNENTLDVCKLHNLESLMATDLITIEGARGQVAVNGKIDMSIHDLGYIGLKPDHILPKTSLIWTANSKEVQIAGRDVSSSITGHFVRQNGTWHELFWSPKPNTVEVAIPMLDSGQAEVEPISLNTIRVDAKDKLGNPVADGVKQITFSFEPLVD